MGKDEDCSHCNGHGDVIERCNRCDGSSMVEDRQGRFVICPECHGSRKSKYTCVWCRGTGKKR